MLCMRDEKRLSPRQLAEQMNVAYTTVMSWLQQGLIEGAIKQETPHGHYWEIPLSALKTFKRPKVGRPQKKAIAKQRQPKAT
jgi:hypothetical protein